MIPHSFSLLSTSRLPIGAWTTDYDLNITNSVSNPRIDRYFSSSSAIVLRDGKTSYDLSYAQHPDVSAHLRARRGETVEWRTGPGRQFHACVTPMIGPAEKIIGVAGVAVDNGRESEENERRRQAEFLFKSLLDATPSPISVLDNAGRVIIANAAYLSAVGKGADDVLACDEGSLIPACETNDSAANPTTPPSEADGFRWVSVNGESFHSQRVPLRDNSGSMLTLHVTRNTTKEDSLRRGLQETVHHFRRVFEALDRPVAAVSSEGLITEANGAFIEILNAQRSHLIGSVLDGWIGNPSRDSFQTIWKDALANGMGQAEGVLFKGANNSCLLGSVSAFCLSENEPSHAVLVLIDKWGETPGPPTSGSAINLCDIDARILELLAAGKSNAEISDELCLSRQGTDYRLKALKERLRAPSRGALVARAYALGLFDHSQWPPVCRRPHEPSNSPQAGRG